MTEINKTGFRNKFVMTGFILFFIYTVSFSNTIDTVYSFKPGTGQDSGQMPEYFPKNIFGLPSTNASYELPEASPEQLLSLGMGGEIVVGIKNYKIINDDGPDFTIFENPFFNPVTKKIFAEPAKVSVSQDGVNFIEFPFNATSLHGLAGKTPTEGKQDPYNPQLSGGDSYDLSDLGLDFITHIKITDVTKIIENLNSENLYYQPAFILTGFDLDAIVALHTQKFDSVNSVGDDLSLIQILQTANSIFITNNSNSNFDLQIFNYMGNQLFEQINNYESQIIINNLESGLYFLILKSNNSIISKKIVITK